MTEPRISAGHRSNGTDALPVSLPDGRGKQPERSLLRSLVSAVGVLALIGGVQFGLMPPRGSDVVPVIAAVLQATPGPATINALGGN